MLDIKFIRQNPEKVKDGCWKKGVKVDIDRLLELDKKKRGLLQEIEGLRAEQNRISKELALRSLAPKSLGARLLKRKIKLLEPELENTEKELENLLQQIPNLPLDEVPEGKDEKDNKILREVGKKPKFNFKPKDYLTIAENLDLIDMERAAKVSGTRFGYLKNEAVLLEFALVQLAFDVLIKQGFIPIAPPVMIKPEPYKGTGRLLAGQEQERYYLSKDELYLVGSAEHTLAPMHLNEVFEEKDLPRRYVGFSTCFRREAGSYGKDTKGILRVHQFDKVEMFSFVKPEDSLKEHEFLLAQEEKLMQLLEIPYRVALLCAGDMDWIDVKQYDIEAWLAGQNQYRETHSCSNTADFQARGLNIRYREKKTSRTAFVHMLNATALAIGRMIIAILENYQQKDGSVVVPKVLRKYVGKNKMTILSKSMILKQNGHPERSEGSRS
ncbi:MAG: serine--tRNA ligase [Candidatus Portnoybacteria bacterium RIFCSPLOWO2_12_FULL_39_9]|uniref:Serine--tRNA ligase n=1 Tax=Candidatus Portnoybacteria bacterium RIFCSPHIGHO2_12_FULL_38_9 TaxID=1801997 RepID=A0A1G2FE24_9BACT|nr:MAG: serine--tRNA ligase [Candidatus Portnoybacteria bacterium RBG_13_40_8]OGZ35652.1 MAG: serine--tRNA ligase [Candidatus Portnoybacteria bacterium RIFCSPHIGHO2_02_FULL_39_12]OGZ36305.1 MAG: serine--tRNA ligase [Candidatus Portnoybacteria bacterium RIFCSPHIGHO2_12_FULL_38_9]OGZ37853.1 MAG: serine--tRNA ligase [Candidatus Portnoybacteria bacterium RIFCSPLOWO2_01_FULL_38_39]OGZ40769.1 MAG: serine--tRNA ligase [Candidatus Portnoybacteria bacterium RIFCSPLOWO2_12_FULL_39_9]